MDKSSISGENGQEKKVGLFYLTCLSGGDRMIFAGDFRVNPEMEPDMSFGNKIAVRILLLIAKMYADADHKRDIESLAFHINYTKEEAAK